MTRGAGARSRARTDHASVRDDLHRQRAGGPSAHGRPSVQPWYLAASRRRAERLALLALDHPSLPVQRPAADAHPHARLGPQVAHPVRTVAAAGQAGRSARRRCRTRSRSCAVGRSSARSSGGGTPTSAPACAASSRGAFTAAAGGRDRVHAAASSAGSICTPGPASAATRCPTPRGRAAPPAEPADAVAQEVEDRPEPGVAVLGAHGAGVDDHHDRGAQRDRLVQTRGVVVEERDAPRRRSSRAAASSRSRVRQ